MPEYSTEKLYKNLLGWNPGLSTFEISSDAEWKLRTIGSENNSLNCFFYFLLRYPTSISFNKKLLGPYHPITKSFHLLR